MANATDEAAANLDALIEDTKAQLERLESARSALNAADGGRSTASRPQRRSSRRPASKTAAKKSRTKANARRRTGKSTSSRKAGARGRVDRGAEFKQIVGRNPVITPSQAAKQMGVSPQQVHGLIKRLSDRGELQRSKKGFTVKT